MTAFRFALLACVAATPLMAQDHREMGSHVHGVSVLELAVDHGHVEMNLHAPGADIVGFEYEASSDADKDAVDAAIRMLIQPEMIIGLPAVAECRLDEVLAHLHSGDHSGHDDEEGHEAHDHAGDHDDHEGHKHAHDEDHDDHDHEGHDHEDHEGHKDHDHEDHADEGGTHSEFHARYKFTCEHPEKLAVIDLPFFAQFPNAQEIEAFYVTETGAGKAEVARDVAKLTLN